MAIRDSSSSQSEWAQLYQRNVPSQPTAGGGRGGSTSGGVVFGRDSPMTESTVVTTTTMVSASSPAGSGGDRVQTVSDGRVGKAARRRTRASRKAPTTVLNTDTTNFRAMVQQFTGVPRVPFQGGYPHMADAGAGAGGGAATLSFGLAGGAAQLYQRPAGFPFGVQQQQQQQHLQFQQHHERPLFTLGGAGSSDVYLRGFGGNPERGGMDASEGLLLEGIPPSQLMPRPATDSTTTNRFLL